MNRPDPRNVPLLPTLQGRTASAADRDADSHSPDDARLLLRLAGASTLAILALAVASIVI